MRWNLYVTLFIFIAILIFYILQQHEIKTVMGLSMYGHVCLDAYASITAKFVLY